MVGTVMATSGLVAAAIAPTTAFWLRFVRQRTAAVLALACGASGLLLAPHLFTIPGVYLVPALVGVGGGLTLPLLLGIVADATPADRRGVALGLRGMMNQAAGTVAPVIIGPLITALGLTLGFTTGGVLTLVLLSTVLLKRDPHSPPAQPALPETPNRS